MLWMLVKNLCVFFCGLIVLVACSQGAFPSEQENLETAKARWKASSLTNYAFTVRWSCFCPPDYTDAVRIIVRDGQVNNIRYTETGLPVKEAFKDRFPNVDGFLKILQDAIDRPVAKFSASYDETHGYPTFSFIDYIKDAVDDETGFSITNFEISN